MPSTVAGCRVAQNSSSSASGMSPSRSLNSVNLLRAKLIDYSFGVLWGPLGLAAGDPITGKLHQGVVFLRRADGDSHTVRAVGTDDDSGVRSPCHEVRRARAQWQPDEVSLRRRQGESGIPQSGGDPGALGDHGVGASE